jgi:AraC-like DNA-binding protein
MTRYLDVSRAGVLLLAGVRFRPAGALPFIESPAGELLEWLSDDRPRDLLVERAVERLHRNGGALSVSALASSAGVSARQLRRRFEAAVGLSPKFLSRIVRLQGVLRNARGERRANGGEKVDWAAGAVEAGFYDLAHLINDFRDWTGMSPASYLAAR